MGKVFPQARRPVTGLHRVLFCSRMARFIRRSERVKKQHMKWIVGIAAVLLTVGAAVIPHGSREAGAQARAGAASAPGAGAPGSVTTKKTEQVRGFSLQLFDSTPEGAENYLKALDELGEMGCTWVNLVIAARQDNIKSEVVQFNEMNVPSEPNLERIVLKAKSLGMGVMLMPIVLLNNAGPKDWRGVINPPSWDNWFATYTSFITRMARLSQKVDVDIFCVGSELLSTEPDRERWIDTIAQIRLVYKGKLTYSANWDHYDTAKGGPSFWDQLDYIGMNNYNELAHSPGASPADLAKAWAPIKKDILDFVAKQKKPFMFTEVGWHNLVNTIAQPWNYVAEGSIDLQEQLHAYESFVKAWQGVPKDQFMGAFVWEWRRGSKPDERGSYSLQGTPSLDVVKQWMTTR